MESGRDPATRRRAAHHGRFSGRHPGQDRRRDRRRRTAICDPWIKGAGEFHFVTKVHTPDNGGNTQVTRIPEKGIVKISDKPGRNVEVFDQEIFRGYVEDDLRIEVVGTEQDKKDPDDVIGKYTRVLCGPVGSMLGEYKPDDESPIEPEDMLLWRLWYRVERA